MLGTIDLILNIMFTGFASLSFFYVYKKSHMKTFLIEGTALYFKMLCRIFLSPISIPLMFILYIPQIIISIYMVYFTYKDGFKIVPLSIIALLFATLLLGLTEHQAYGEIGLIFGLLHIIWISNSHLAHKIDPWEPDKKHNPI